MFKQMLLSNLDIDNCNRDYRRLIMINAVFLMANVVYIGFTIINTLKGDYFTALVDILFAVPALYGYFELRHKKDIQRASTFAILLLFFTMLIVLFLFQAKEYTILWSLLFAFIAMMLKGERVGMIYITLFYAIAYSAAFTWVGQNILLSEYIRYVGVSLVVIFIAYFYEKSIARAFENLYETNNELQDLNKNLEANVQKGIEELRQKDELVARTAKNALLGEMIGAISHQWKQPLQALSLTLYDFKDAKAHDELTDEYIDKSLEHAAKQIDFMSQTITDFKDFLKPDKNKEEFYIHDAVKNVLNLLEKQLKNYDIRVRFTYDRVQIINYKGELEQVVLNLINNAKDELVKKKESTPDFQPQISIEVTRKGDYNALTVTDNGNGIPDVYLEKIFEAHFSTKPEDKGTGIGLYISKMIMENSLGGTISADNTANGARFTLSF